MRVNEERPLFSILIANYNGGKYIGKSLEGAINQTYPNIEIVVVDDGSLDDSIEILDRFKRDNICVYKNDKNYGCGYTKKKCIDLSSGEIFGFLDADDYLASDAVEEMVRLHVTRVDAAIIYSNYYECDENLKILKTHRSKNSSSQKTHLKDHRISHFATIKTSKYEETSGINPNFKRAVDQDLYYKLEEVGEVHHYDSS
ncbi:MAG: glycosyltransferase, partial [Bacteroidota bacterium]